MNFSPIISKNLSGVPLIIMEILSILKEEIKAFIFISGIFFYNELLRCILKSMTLYDSCVSNINIKIFFLLLIRIFLSAVNDDILKLLAKLNCTIIVSEINFKVSFLHKTEMHSLYYVLFFREC
jgi:hypothetical protein